MNRHHNYAMRERIILAIHVLERRKGRVIYYFRLNLKHWAQLTNCEPTNKPYVILGGIRIYREYR